MGIDPGQLLTYVVRPALKALDLPGGVLAEKLVMGTAAQESRFQYLHQLGKGPALSLWQIEPVTAMDTLRRAPAWCLDRLDTLCPGALPVNNSNVIDRLVGDLFLGAGMCRLVYYMRKFRWPEEGTAETLWPIYKTRYNTRFGAATETQWLAAWKRHGLDELW